MYLKHYLPSGLCCAVSSRGKVDVKFVGAVSVANDTHDGGNDNDDDRNNDDDYQVLHVQYEDGIKYWLILGVFMSVCWVINTSVFYDNLRVRLWKIYMQYMCQISNSVRKEHVSE